jgi:hypothetical protein
LNLPNALFEGYVTLCEYTMVYYEHTKATYNEVYHDGQAVALMRCNETSDKHAEYQPNTRSRDRVAFILRSEAEQLRDAGRPRSANY